MKNYYHKKSHKKIGHKNKKTFPKDVLFHLISTTFKHNTRVCDMLQPHFHNCALTSNEASYQNIPIFYSNKIVGINDSMLNDMDYLKHTYSEVHAKLMDFCKTHNLDENTQKQFMIVFYDPSQTRYGLITKDGYLLVDNYKQNLDLIEDFLEIPQLGSCSFKYKCDDGTIESSPNFLFALVTKTCHERRAMAMKFVAEYLMNMGDCDQTILTTGKNLYKALPDSFKVFA